MINYFRHLFTPHHTNNHRPKILHNASLSIIIVLILGLVFTLPSLRKEYPSVLGISSNISIGDLISLTNQKRAEAGLQPLTLNSQLSSAANSKASYMFEKNFWAHVAPDGTTPWYFIKNSGYEYLYAGENLARGFNSAPDVINAWMASPTHRENMLSPNYRDIGFAIETGSLTGADTVLVVEELGSKYSAQQNSSSNKSVPAVVQNSSNHPTPALSISITPVVNRSVSKHAIQAAINKPLIDTKSTKQNIALIILVILILVLIVDAVIIERKKIVRVVSHNLDHIIFLSILLLAAMIIGGGIIK